MTLSDLKTYLEKDPSAIEFSDVLSLIDSLYSYTPCDFTNGLGEDIVENKAGTNEGSCKLFAFSQDQQFNEEQTLYCFGKFYTQDVLQNPTEKNHANIRNFIKYGWEGITFSGMPLLKNK